MNSRQIRVDSKSGRVSFYIGLTKRFNGIGIMWDKNPAYSIRPFETFEIQFFWFKTWIAIYSKKPQ